MSNDNLPATATAGTGLSKAKPNHEVSLIGSLKSTSALELAKQITEQMTMTLIALQKGITIGEAATAKTVAQTVQRLGEPTVIKVVCAVFRLFNDGLNTSLQMTPLQLFEAAQIWCETYPHETLKDLILCLKRAKAGQYGPIFNRVDVTVISDFFRQYLLQKADYLEQQNRQYISDHNTNLKQTFAQLPKEQQLALGEMMKKPNLRKTPSLSMPTHEQYVNWLRDNADEVEFEDLIDIKKRSESHNNHEVARIVNQAIERRETNED